MLLNAAQDLIHGLGRVAPRQSLIAVFSAFPTRLPKRRRHGNLQLIQFVQSIGTQQLEFGLPQGHLSCGSAKAVTGETFTAQYRQYFVQQ